MSKQTQLFFVSFSQTFPEVAIKKKTYFHWNDFGNCIIIFFLSLCSIKFLFLTYYVNNLIRYGKQSYQQIHRKLFIFYENSYFILNLSSYNNFLLWVSLMAAYKMKFI